MQARTKTELLLAVRDEIRRYNRRFICAELNCLTRNNLEKKRATDIKIFTRRLLGGAGSLEIWMGRQHPKLLGNRVAFSAANKRKFAETRLAWVDWVLTQPEITGRKV